MREKACDMESARIHVALSDDRFMARMRVQQSWNRRHILGLSSGSSPSVKGALCGSQITEADGRAG